VPSKSLGRLSKAKLRRSLRRGYTIRPTRLPESETSSIAAQISDGLYMHPPILKAHCRIINEPFRLSKMLARTLRQGLPAQNLHADFERDSHGWTIVNFISMVA